MPIRKSYAEWNGNLVEGGGKITVGENAWESKIDFNSRFEEGDYTNPEELIGAAHAACFSMALSHELAGKNFKPINVKTQAEVKLVKIDQGFKIKEIALSCRAKVEGISEGRFQEIANDAKENCPVSMALSGVNIILDAKLE